MPGKSTTDWNLKLRVLVERRREFRQGMFVAYSDLKKVFGSVHRVALWVLLFLCGILARIIGWVLWSVEGRVKLLSCEYGSEAGMCAYSITFQYLHG